MGCDGARKKMEPRLPQKKKRRSLQSENWSERRLGVINRGEQIVGTQDESQQIVAQRLLSCLQYLDATKSSAKDLSFLWISL